VAVLFVSSSSGDLENENIVWDFCFSNVAGDSIGIGERNLHSVALSNYAKFFRNCPSNVPELELT
jgi:hypothetical protein